LKDLVDGILEDRAINDSEVNEYILETAILHQNKPNPYGDVTRIEYNLESISFTSARLSIFNHLGEFVKSFPINSSSGIVELNSSDVANGGIYSYSLFVDGKIIKSKKMVKFE